MGSAKDYLGSGCRTAFRWLKLNARFAAQRITKGRDERSPIDPEEFILRKVHKKHYDPKLKTPILRLGFTPNKSDKDGLSVSRELFITARRLAWTGKQAGEYYVARLKARQLMQEYGFTFRPDVDDEAPGHAVIPELRFSDARAEMRKLEPVAKRLAELGSQAVVHTPAQAKNS